MQEGSFLSSIGDQIRKRWKQFSEESEKLPSVEIDMSQMNNYKQKMSEEFKMDDLQVNGASQYSGISAKQFDILVSQERSPLEQSQYTIVQTKQIVSWTNVVTDQVLYDYLNEGEEDYKALTLQDWTDLETGKKEVGDFKRFNIYYSLMIGFPEEKRKVIWMILSQINSMKQKPKYFDINYAELSKRPSINSDQINLDVKRTDLDGEQFDQEDRDLMRRILNAYVNFNKGIGYCQGMNCLVAGLLLNMSRKEHKQVKEQNFDVMDTIEEDIFWMFLYIIEEKNWKDHFIEGFIGTIKAVHELQLKIKSRLPLVYEHFIKVNKQVNEDEDLINLLYLYFFPYYPTLLLYGTPQLFARFALDLFIFDEKVSIDSLIITMIQLFQDQILAKNYQELTIFFQKEIFQHCNQLLIEQQSDKSQKLENFKLNYFRITKISD